MTKKLPGAKKGRPKGAHNKKTKEIIAKAEAQGVMPLDVMLHNMRATHGAVVKIEQKMAESKADVTDQIALLALREASETCAKDAAPYLHQRLSAVETTTKPYDFSKLTDQEFEQLGQLLHRLADAGAVAGGTGPQNSPPAPRRGPTLN